VAGDDGDVADLDDVLVAGDSALSFYSLT